MDTLIGIYKETGFAQLEWQMVVMWLVTFGLLYLAIVKKYEPLLLVPIALGALIANLPITEFILQEPVYSATGEQLDAGGLFYYFNQGIKLQIFPPLIFLGVGALTDFGPLIANPRTLLLGAAAQFGIFFTFLCAPLMGFNLSQAAAIGIIGGADGPTSIYVASELAPEQLGAIAIAAYSYMALVPLVQPPVMRLLTTEKERKIKMKTLRHVSQLEKIVFALMVMIFCLLVIPDAAPLLSMLFIGNLLRESKVTERLVKAAQNEIINIVTIFLGLCVGLKMGGYNSEGAHNFLNTYTLSILGLGMLAFVVATAAGVIMAKLMNSVSKNKINPLIGSAGVSAVPMAARVSQDEGQKADPSNYLLMHAMGPNVAGVIGSALAAGYFLAVFSN
ncbi:sodium ion-translocating decarboxylase subunit beta [Persicirhabdus sediminis]|uniref:Sodium ion-translocating decarboxylase subunit beta n=1 Tax=Persicirhabdus sediminis TaxID=454144 RepID=A0A8J7SMG1_9BACT|nr:sodium ion-translocating decarboxylase subunit beta [Persicirhabdus sediminis]MBK1792055.1 sodium ion-translocating decarboxylase subunit beta [Persicirhabdus sediminis]